jgi:hypothetical protein
VSVHVRRASEERRGYLPLGRRRARRRRRELTRGGGGGAEGPRVRRVPRRRADGGDSPRGERGRGRPDLVVAAAVGAEGGARRGVGAQIVRVQAEEPKRDGDAKEEREIM